MKKYTFLGVILLSIGIISFALLNINKLKPKGAGGLQVTSNIKSNVYLNGKPIGSTPLCKCTQDSTVKEGEYLLKVEPEDKNLMAFSYKIKVGKGVLTAVERTFLPGALASSSILNLEKIDKNESQLLITSIPDGAMVSIDSNPQGITPFLIKNLSASEHEVELRKEGFSKKTLRVRTVAGYKLIAYVILGTQGSEESTPSPTISPAAIDTASSSASIKIKDTPTGFLRVREEPSLSGQEIARVNPGEIFVFLEEQEGWYKIRLKNNTNGWISSSFAEKTTSQ